MPLSAPLLEEYLQAIPPKTRQKGDRIYDETSQGPAAGELELEVLDQGPRSILLLVPSDSNYYGYEVKISWTKIKVTARCQCLAFEEYGPCKHIVAGIRYLQDNEALDDTTPAPAAKEEAAPEEALIVYDKMTLRSGPANVFRDIDYRFSYGDRAIKKEAARIESAEFRQDEGIWDFVCRESAKRRHHPRIVYDKREQFQLSCTCGPTLFVCVHLFAAAAYLYEQGGSNYFVQFRDFSREKAQVLAKLGLQPDEPAAADVEFFVDNLGRFNYRVPQWLWPAEKVDMNITALQNQLGLVGVQSQGEPQVFSPGAFSPAVVFQTVTSNLPFPFELVVVNTAEGKFAKLSTANEERWPELRSGLPANAYKAIIQISQPRLNRLLANANIYQPLPGLVRQLSPGQRTYEMLAEAYRAGLRLLWPWLSGGGVPVYATAETRFTKAAQVSPIQLEPSPVTAAVLIRPAGPFIELRLRFRRVENETFVEEDLEPVAGMLLRAGNSWYLPADEQTLQLMKQFPAGFVRVPATAEQQVFGSLLPMLREVTAVEVDPAFRLETARLSPEVSLQLAEKGNKHLVLMPRFSYGANTFYYEPEPAPFISQNEAGGWQEVIRDSEAEAAFSESIRALHPRFETGPAGPAYFIPFAEALNDSWYQKMLAQLAERGIAVTGIENLQHFRYNANEAKVSVSSPQGAGSGIDWFDLLIEISFGDQQVSLKEVRKALMLGQAGVRLADGSIGLLPERFVQEYGTLLKLGTEKNGRLQVSKLHFTLIDELHENALSKDLRAEIAAKKEALHNIENVRTAVVPASLRATLRPYQTAGYHWLQQLDQLGWGGCLADDMGLGKTLQTIAFLQYLQEGDGKRIHLVVCPTSLIYNWQAELEKFAPALRYHIHYGAARTWNPAALTETDVVITSYGLLRADLERLMGMPWYCVVLDESQAIKNPVAQTTKAVQLLPARIRICLSGTPLQNNTFDLYAQFQFLNPGLLGSQEFFRSEFATPIDKHSEEGPRSALRRLLAPFMLRRTKEQVAPELPDKTEAVLWCEMEPAQRAVYEEYRNFYRDSLLKRIDTEGMAGASIYVLEALLRLRQLCDHPALVKNKEVKTAASIKLDELRREIRENAGGRKVLVFSQFTEMLGLIVKAFEEDGIAYAYLDGQTPAAKRKSAVERFQNDPSVQVFLISLKAGGVGLNLTAAEYVYIVDPWWNPAAEAQAIDRTHRIGQQNKIVAYRMICKDTVEEKVLQLQQRKKALAEGLVTEDAGFVKKLTREDVAFLLEG